jgi:N-glycosylase/DNA lyase
MSYNLMSEKGKLIRVYLDVKDMSNVYNDAYEYLTNKSGAARALESKLRKLKKAEAFEYEIQEVERSLMEIPSSVKLIDPVGREIAAYTNDSYGGLWELDKDGCMDKRVARYDNQ